MSTPTVLMVASDELRAGCRLLRAAGAELDALGARVRSSGVDDAWSGLAALEQRARVQVLQTVISSTSGPPELVAAAVERCADEADAAALQVRSWARVKDEAVAEARALRAAGPPPEPALEEVWRRRLLELDQRQGTATTRSLEAQEQYAVAQGQAARVIDQAGATIQEMESIWKLSTSMTAVVGYTAGLLARLVLVTDAALAVSRARRTQGERTRARAQQRARGRMDQLRRVSRPGATPPNAKLLKLTPGPVGMLLTLFSAGKEVRTGGGYEGWRGNVTRVLAGGALAGLPAMVVGIAFPPAALVGAGLITTYGAWSAGNALWDGRGTLIRYARQFGRSLAGLRDTAVGVTKRAAMGMQRVRNSVNVAVGRVVLGAGHTLVQARDVVGDAVGSVAERRHRVIGLAPPSPISIPLREEVNAVLGRMPDVAPMREWWRDVGQPIRLPAVPLGPVLRAPVDLGRWWP